MKNIFQIAQLIVLLALIAAGGLMMSGTLTMPTDPETRSAVTAIGAVLFIILDAKGLVRERQNEKDPGSPVAAPGERLHDDRDSVEGR